MVVVLAYATWWLGEWQFGRLEDRKRDNAVVERNEALAPPPWTTCWRSAAGPPTTSGGW